MSPEMINPDQLLASCRAKIDDIDELSGKLFGKYFSSEENKTKEQHELTINKLSALYAGRMAITAEVGMIKAKNGIEPIQPGRFEEVKRAYERNRQLYFSHVDPREFYVFVEFLHETSLNQQNEVAAADFPLSDAA